MVGAPAPMTTSRATASLGLGLGLLVGAGCVARVIVDGDCGDGVLQRGEICLGLGARSELRIEGLEGLLLRVADFDGDAHLDLLVLGTEPQGTYCSWLARPSRMYIRSPTVMVLRASWRQAAT